MHRRSFITGLISLVAAPASLMPVHTMSDDWFKALVNREINLLSDMGFMSDLSSYGTAAAYIEGDIVRHIPTDEIWQAISSSAPHIR